MRDHGFDHPGGCATPVVTERISDPTLRAAHIEDCALARPHAKKRRMGVGACPGDGVASMARSGFRVPSVRSSAVENVIL